MLGVYLFAAIVGAGLLAFSLLAGGGDADHDVGHDHPVLADADHPGFGELVLAFLRPRNFIFGAAGFGLTGTLLTILGAGAGFTLLAASTMGAGFFLLSHGVFTLLKRADTAVDPVSDTQLMGERARVTLPLEPGRPGKIACLLGGREVYLTARLAADVSQGIPSGREVVVVRVTNGVAEVATPEDFERLLPEGVP
jgi:hypothetical protein